MENRRSKSTRRAFAFRASDVNDVHRVQILRLQCAVSLDCMEQHSRFGGRYLVPYSFQILQHLRYRKFAQPSTGSSYCIERCSIGLQAV